MKKNDLEYKQTGKTTKKKKWIPVLIVIAIFWVIGAALGGEEVNPDKSSAEKIIDLNKDIIWKDEDNMGIANIELDGNHTKEVIIANYYTEVFAYINKLDKESLKEYKYIEFKGNVMSDGKIDCTIKGDVDIEFIKTSTDLTPANIESNIQNLFIPKPLQ